MNKKESEEMNLYSLGTGGNRDGSKDDREKAEGRGKGTGDERGRGWIRKTGGGRVGKRSEGRRS